MVRIRIGIPMSDFQKDETIFLKKSESGTYVPLANFKRCHNHKL